MVVITEVVEDIIKCLERDVDILIGESKDNYNYFNNSQIQKLAELGSQITTLTIELRRSKDEIINGE